MTSRKHGTVVACVAGMHRFGLLVWLAACGWDGSAITSCPPSYPGGMACEGSLACDYAQPERRTQFCVCTRGHMWCSDCSTSEYGFGECSAGEHCEYSSWETDCSCSCTANGRWNCTGLDAVSPCPRDP